MVRAEIARVALGQPVPLSPYAGLTKLAGILQELRTGNRFHLIYYDAFAPSAQPELWEPEVLGQLADLLLPGGMLTTYCFKSDGQRNRRAAGLTVEKHPGRMANAIFYGRGERIEQPRPARYKF